MDNSSAGGGFEGGAGTTPDEVRTFLQTSARYLGLPCDAVERRVMVLPARHGAGPVVAGTYRHAEEAVK